jgi:dsRNA-specific ribonuclease
VFKNDPEAGENEICERRNCFLTNKELYRLGISLNLRRYIRTLDGDVDNWVAPFVKLSSKIKENRNYFVETKFTGKNIADCCEALIAAYMLSGGVRHALEFVSRIGAIPLDKCGLLDQFPKDQLTINIKEPSTYKIQIDANFQTLFNEY